MTDQELLSLHRPRFKLHPVEMDLKALRVPPGDKASKGLRVAFWTLGGKCILVNAAKEELQEALEGTVDNFTQSESRSTILLISPTLSTDLLPSSLSLLKGSVGLFSRVTPRST